MQRPTLANGRLRSIYRTVMTAPTRKIGNSEVSSIGYGAMGIAAYYDTVLPDEERMKVCGDAYTSSSSCSSYISFRYSMVYTKAGAPTGIRPMCMPIVNSLSGSGTYVSPSSR